MRGLILLAAVAAVAVARPESYKEKEEFEYSRSSTDEGSKSGFYGAQRGNMGGNYEKAHNMDDIAQKQMSGAIRQIDGQLGDASNARVGDVYSASNTRGIYGQGQYDLSNLQGRNFRENANYDDLRTQSASLNSGYGTHSSLHNSMYNSGHFGSDYSGGYGGGNYRRSENLHDDGSLATQYGVDSGHHAAYHTKSSEYRYDHSNINSGYGSNLHNRMIGVPAGSPVKVSIRPGSTVSLPVGVETYDAGHNSAYNQHLENSDVELLSRTENPFTNYEPSGSRTSKHYESGYKYRKEWEKHDSLPAVAPLSIPSPSSGVSGQLIDAQHNNDYYGNVLDSHSSSRKHYSGYKGAAASTKSQYESAYNANQHSDAYKNAEALASTFDSSDINNIKTEPKTYQSSYAYHKTWERQGDPYVIVPAGEQSQRITALNNQGSQYGSRYSQSHKSYTQAQEDCECDEQGNVRVTRSADFQQQEDLTQQTQNDWENLGQQNSWNQEHSGKLKDFGQHTQNEWNAEDLTQQTQDNNWDRGHLRQQPRRHGKLEDFGHHAQHKWDAEDSTQQTQQHNWDMDQLRQQSQRNGKLEDFGQRTQHTWEAEDLTQQTQQNDWDMDQLRQQSQRNDKLEDFGQHTQNKWDAEDLTQQTQHDGFHSNVYNQHRQRNNQDHRNQHQLRQHDDIVQHTQNRWDAEDNFRQASQHIQTSVENGTTQINGHMNSSWEQHDIQTQNSFKNSPYNTDDLTQHANGYLHTDSWDSNKNADKSIQHLWNKIDKLVQSSMEEDTNNQSFSGYHDYYQTNTTGHKNENNENIFSSGRNRGDIESENHDDREPSNRGRGDIESGDKLTLTTIKPYYNSYPHIYTSSNVHEPKYKTPEEIEALSLSKNSKEQHDSEYGHRNINTDISDVRSSNDDSYGVLGLNQQWLNEQSRNSHTENHTQSGDSQYIYNVNARTTGHKSRREQEHSEYYGQTDTNSWSQSNIQGQASSYNRQQDASNVALDRASQRSSNSQTYINGSQQHLGQENLNLEQQSQTNWGENLGQVQSSWSPNKQQSENLNSSSKHDKLKDDFYKELHAGDNLQSSQIQGSTTSTILTNGAPDDTSTTPKPGFWKSVGDKVVSTTGKVANWFKTVKIN